MTSPRQPDSRPARSQEPFLAAAVVGSVGVVVAGSAAQVVNHAFSLGIDALDSVDDGGAFGVVGDVAAGSAAAAGWLVLARVRPTHPAAVVLPPLLTFVAVDKAVRLHDRIPHYLVLYGPVLVAVFVCVALLSRRVPPACARLLVVGLVLLALSFGLHVVGERALTELGLEQAGWVHQVKAVAKHGAEVQGWLLLFLGLAVTGIRGWRTPGSASAPVSSGESRPAGGSPRQ